MGGVYTALAIEKVLPILHSGPGCQTSYGAVLAGSNGGQNAATYMESCLPCTNFCESDVVFGGMDRLRMLTEGSLRYFDADAFMIASGCTPEIIGDDIEDIVREFSSLKKPVINVPLPGFKGNNLWGHSQVLSALIDTFAKKPDSNNTIIKGQVNILGIIPYYDTMWNSTLIQLEEMLSQIGLKPNVLYGRGKTVENLKMIPSAEFNLVLAPWTDLDIAEKLKERYGTPYLHYPNLPTGSSETAKFIRCLTQYAGIDKTQSERYISEQEDKYNYFIDRSLVWLFDMHNLRSLPRSFYIISSAAQCLSLTKFLVNDMGMTPRKIFITDDVPEGYRPSVTAFFRELDGCTVPCPDIVFTDDGGALELCLRGVDQSVDKACILGSVWDDLLAKKLNMPYVSVSAPYGDLLIGDKTYFGAGGAISLICDIYNDAAQKGLMSSVI
jgi:nitrogenase molybdenum-iron protein beta chain